MASRDTLRAERAGWPCVSPPLLPAWKPTLAVVAGVVAGMVLATSAIAEDVRLLAEGVRVEVIVPAPPPADTEPTEPESPSADADVPLVEVIQGVDRPTDDVPGDMESDGDAERPQMIVVPPAPDDSGFGDFDFASCWIGPTGEPLLLTGQAGTVAAYLARGHRLFGALEGGALTLTLTFKDADDWRAYWGPAAGEYTDADIGALLDAGYAVVMRFEGLDEAALADGPVLEGESGATHWPDVSESGEVTILPVEDHPQRAYLAPAPVTLTRTALAACEGIVQ